MDIAESVQEAVAQENTPTKPDVTVITIDDFRMVPGTLRRTGNDGVKYLTLKGFLYRHLIHNTMFACLQAGGRSENGPVVADQHDALADYETCSPYKEGIDAQLEEPAETPVNYILKPRKDLLRDIFDQGQEPEMVDAAVTQFSHDAQLNFIQYHAGRGRIKGGSREIIRRVKVGADRLAFDDGEHDSIFLALAVEGLLRMVESAKNWRMMGDDLRVLNFLQSLHDAQQNIADAERTEAEMAEATNVSFNI